METETRKKSEAQKEKELKKIKAFLRAVLPSAWDKYDITAKWDSSLTYLENKNRIVEEIKTLFGNDFIGETLKEQAAHLKSQQEKWVSEENARIEDEVERYNRELQYVESKELDEFYTDVDRALTKLCKGYAHLVFIKGRGGIGKSRRIRHNLTKHEEAFYEITGDVTEAYLYRLFYENNGKTLWFKDVTRLLRGMNCLPWYSLVKTNNGIKTMKELDPKKDLVASWNWKSGLEYKGFRKESTGTKRVVKIQINGEVLESSPEHKWIVKTPKGIVEKEAKDLNIHDVLLRLQ